MASATKHHIVIQSSLSAVSRVGVAGVLFVEEVRGSIETHACNAGLKIIQVESFFEKLELLSCSDFHEKGLQLWNPPRTMEHGPFSELTRAFSELTRIFNELVPVASVA